MRTNARVWSLFTFLMIIIVVSTTLTTSVNAASYNRTTAVTYADTWAKSRNSNYPNYGTGTNCNDCTNYISQVLNQGGVPQISGSDDEWHWYTWRNIFGTWYGSKSWAATDWLNRHASQFQSTRVTIQADALAARLGAKKACQARPDATPAERADLACGRSRCSCGCDRRWWRPRWCGSTPTPSV